MQGGHSYDRKLLMGDFRLKKHSENMGVTVISLPRFVRKKRNIALHIVPEPRHSSKFICSEKKNPLLHT